jgi:hypothetical protein
LNSLDPQQTSGAAPPPDISLKNYEFTEKCLSFRLASIDLNSSSSSSSLANSCFNSEANLANTTTVPPNSHKKEDIDIKLINYYEKFLCALVNYRINNQTYYKLYRIRHEDTTATATTQTNDSATGTPAASQPQITSQPSLIGTPTTNTLPNCLSATSSSRLNLAELALPLDLIPANNRVISIIPISITTLDEDSDLKFVALLDESGTINIINPNKSSKIANFNLNDGSIEQKLQINDELEKKDDEEESDKFVQMIYCHGIDKICAWTRKGKIYFLSTRLENLNNQFEFQFEESNLLFGLGGLSTANAVDVDALNHQVDLNKKLLVSSPIDSEVGKKKIFMNIIAIF